MRVDLGTSSSLRLIKFSAWRKTKIRDYQRIKSTADFDFTYYDQNYRTAERKEDSTDADTGRTEEDWHTCRIINEGKKIFGREEGDSLSDRVQSAKMRDETGATEGTGAWKERSRKEAEENRGVASFVERENGHIQIVAETNC